MTYSIEQSDGTETITLEGDLTVSSAEELRNLLIRSLSDSSRVGVNLEHVAEVDLTILQLLCSAHRTSAQMNKSIGFTGALPEALKNIAVRSGFARHAGCPRDINKNCIWVGL